MKKIDLIIQTLQKELALRKKSYFILAQATKILKEKGVLTNHDVSNGYLKKKLENGEIPHARKTLRKPQQWRIHKDNNYEEVYKIANESKKTNVEQITENDFWKEYHKKYPNFKYVLAISITFLVIYFVVLFNKSVDTNNVYEPTSVEKIRKSEIIYKEIKIAFSNEFFDKCETLYKEMQLNYSSYILFDSVKLIYDSAMIKKAQVRKEKVNKLREHTKANSTKNIAHKKINKSLNVSAQAYPDGILSCNVYLVDKNGNIYYLDASSISYTIYSSSGLLNATGKVTTSNTNSGLYIDIPLGTHIFEAKSIKFIINTNSGAIYKSNKVFIDY